MAQRLNQLEAETQSLRAELERLQEQQPKRLPLVDRSGAAAVPADAAPLPAPAPVPPPGIFTDAPPQPTPATSTSYAPIVPPAEDTYTLDELRTEMKKLVWKKGDFSITPYGYLWANTVYETERSNNGDYTLWVYSPQDITQAGAAGQPSYHVDARNTRLGTDILGPRLACFGDCANRRQGGIRFSGQCFGTHRKQRLGAAPSCLPGSEKRRVPPPGRPDMGRHLPVESQLDHVFGVLGCRQHRLPPAAIPRRTLLRHFRHAAPYLARLHRRRRYHRYFHGGLG